MTVLRYPKHVLSVGLGALMTWGVACDSPPVPTSSVPAANTPSALNEAPETPEPEDISLPTAPGAFAPHLAVEGDKVAMTWLEPIPEAPKDAPAKRLRVAFFEKGAWTTPVNVAEGPELSGSWADGPSITLHPKGHMLLHWTQKAGSARHAFDIQLAISGDGQSWKKLGSPHKDGTETEHGFVSTVVEDGGFRLFWLDGRETVADPPGATAIRTATVRDGVASDSEVVDPRVCDCCGTGAALTEQGPVVVYRDRSEAEVRDVSLARSAAQGWAAPVDVGRDRWQLRGCPVNGPVVVADKDLVASAWFTAAGGRDRVKAAFSKDGGATFSAPIDVDSQTGDDAPLGRVAAVMLDGGEVLVSWLDGRGQGAVIRAARVDASGRMGEPVDIAPTSRASAGGFPRAVRVGGDVMFVWTVVEDKAAAKLSASRWPLTLFPPPKGEPRLVSREAKPRDWRRPDLEAKTLDGKAAALSGLDGEAVLVNLWATWCKPCREELPALSALNDTYKTRGLRVIGVSVDAAEATDELKALVKAEKLSFTVWHDPENQASRLFGASALPESFLFDRKGALVWSSAGQLEASDEALNKAIEAALK